MRIEIHVDPSITTEQALLEAAEIIYKLTTYTTIFEKEGGHNNRDRMRLWRSKAEHWKREHIKITL